MSHPPRHTVSSARRVVVASLIGTCLEWYDFFVYGTAAAPDPKGAGWASAAAQEA